uniref:hypothetical protein n=1 Tax=uncultured Parolsenella sp. TaxID=2083008 RepID=UPI0025F3710C
MAGNGSGAPVPPQGVGAPAPPPGAPVPPQGAAPQPPAPGKPARKKKPGRTLPIALAAVLVLVLVGVGLFTFGPLRTPHGSTDVAAMNSDVYSDNLSPDKYDLQPPQ